MTINFVKVELTDKESSDLLHYELPSDGPYSFNLDNFPSTELPVKIKWHKKCRNRYGTHYAHSDHHLIILNPYRSLEETNNTLHHELCHALQSEKFARETGKPTTKFYEEAYALFKGMYKTHPYELDAKAYAKNRTHIMLLRKRG